MSAYFLSLAVPLLVVAWAYQDSRQSGYWPAFHYGLGLAALWPVLVPHYIFRTRGAKGVPLFFALYAALLAPVLGWVVGLLLFPWVWS